MTALGRCPRRSVLRAVLPAVLALASVACTSEEATKLPAPRLSSPGMQNDWEERRNDMVARQIDHERKAALGCVIVILAAVGQLYSLSFSSIHPTLSSA